MTDNTDADIVLDINHINSTTITLAKSKRNQILERTDKYLLSDYPITSSNLILIKDYRQQLRDYVDLDEVKNYNSSSNISLAELPQFPF
jgi:hypothetical protein